MSETLNQNAEQYAAWSAEWFAEPDIEWTERPTTKMKAEAKLVFTEYWKEILSLKIQREEGGQ